MRTILLVILITVSAATYSQKKRLIEKHDEVVEAAILEIENSMQGPEGGLFLLKTENEISGTYTMDIQLYEKGKVASVFCKSKENAQIKSQTLIKDFIKAYKFNFKMPKGKKYKFEYTFNFNN